MLNVYGLEEIGACEGRIVYAYFPYNSLPHF